MPRPRRPRSDLRHPRRDRPTGSDRRPQPHRQRGRQTRVPPRTSTQNRLGAGSSTRITHRCRASRPRPRDHPADRSSPHSRCCRDRPASLPPLPSRRPDRQTSRRATRLPHLHRPHPHRGMRTLRRPPRTSHPRRARPTVVSELLDHRPGQSRSLPQLRPPTSGQHSDTGRADLRTLPALADRDLLDLRRGKALRHIPNHRPAVVSCLPAPHGPMLFLRTDRAPSSRAPSPSRAARTAPPAPSGTTARPAATRPIRIPANAFAA